MFAWMRHLPQLAFWPFNRRREEALRMRLLKMRDELRRDRIAEEASVGSRLSVPERRALSRLTDAEVEEALHIPRTPSSLRAPSSAATTPPADPLSIESTSSPSSSVRAHGTRAP